MGTLSSKWLIIYEIDVLGVKNRYSGKRRHLDVFLRGEGLRILRDVKNCGREYLFLILKNRLSHFGVKIERECYLHFLPPPIVSDFLTVP